MFRRLRKNIVTTVATVVKPRYGTLIYHFTVDGLLTARICEEAYTANAHVKAQGGMSLWQY